MMYGALSDRRLERASFMWNTEANVIDVFPVFDSWEGKESL